MDLQIFSEERKEQPTQKRRQDARRRGQVIKSQEIAVLATLVSAVVSLRLFGPAMVPVARRVALSLWSSFGEEMTERTAVAIMLSSTVDGLLAVLPIALTVALAALLAELAQVGFLLSAEPVAFNLARVDPFQGAGRIFSRRSLVELGKAVIKTAVIAFSVWQVAGGAMPRMPELTGMPIQQAASWCASVLWQMLSRCLVGLLVVAAADYVFQWREHEQSLMMTRRELLEELKETEGRPETRQRIRSRQRQIATGRMMARVKTADVVVTNPDHFAVALAYDAAQMPAPLVVARGAGWLAERIKDEARKHSVTIVENPPIARALYVATIVGELVPPSLYQAVAEILAFVYRLKVAKAAPISP